MADPKIPADETRTISEAEQMYLLTTARLVDGGLTEPVPLAALAEALAVQPVSANQMVHNLKAAGLLAYQPYKGVALTPAGQAHARRVLRYRNLWQRFLTAHLHLDPAEAEALACEFEHATSEAAADRLEEFLSQRAGGTSDPRPSVSLSEITPGKSVTLLQLPDEPPLDAFFTSQGLTTGDTVDVLAHGAIGEVLLRTKAGTLQLSAELARAVRVVPTQE